jgi:hypothetical protein
MLVLSRKVGEKLVIDGNITVEVVRIQGNRITLGIVAPTRGQGSAWRAGPETIHGQARIGGARSRGWPAGCLLGLGYRTRVEHWRPILPPAPFAAGFTNRVAAGTLQFGADLYEGAATYGASWTTGWFRLPLFVWVGHSGSSLH